VTGVVGRLGSVTLERLQESLHAATACIARTLACLLLAVAAALAATGFLIAALYLVLDERLTSTAAAALVGGLLLVVALVLLLVANRGIRRACRAEAVGAGGSRQRPGDAERSSPSELAASLGAVVGDETVKWTRAHPFSALAAALVAGIAVGVSPRLRSELEQLMGALSGKGESGRRDP
jgi:small-conductance mechanosensitive channel